MRIKIQIKNGRNSENMVLSLPKTISTFYDLHQFLLEKLDLKGKPCLKFKLQDQFTVSLNEKIGDIVLDEDRDVLSVEVGNNGKRAALDYDVSEEFEGVGNNKKVKTCGFCKFIEKCAFIKNVFEKEGNISSENIHFNERRGENDEEKSNKAKDKEKIQENIKIPEKLIQKIENPPLKKTFVPAKEEIKKAQIIQKKKEPSESSSDSDESSDSEGFKHKKPEPNIKNPKPIVENASNSAVQIIQKKAAEPLKLNILVFFFIFPYYFIELDPRGRVPKKEKPMEISTKPSESLSKTPKPSKQSPKERSSTKTTRIKSPKYRPTVQPIETPTKTSGKTATLPIYFP